MAHCGQMRFFKTGVKHLHFGTLRCRLGGASIPLVEPTEELAVVDEGVRPHIAAHASRLSLLEVAGEGQACKEPSVAGLLRDGLPSFNGFLAGRVRGNERVVIAVHLLAVQGVGAADQKRVAVLLPNLDFNPLVKLVLQCWKGLRVLHNLRSVRCARSHTIESHAICSYRRLILITGRTLPWRCVVVVGGNSFGNS